jgi:hypothetical protein
VENAQGSAPVVKYLGRVVLDRYLLPPYTPRKALCRKSFPMHDACTYVFGVPLYDNDRDDSSTKYPKRLDDGIVATPTFANLVPVSVDQLRSLRESLLRSPPPRPHSKQKRS